MDDSAFYGGWEFAAHKFLGAHPDGEGAVFRTYAPAAVQVGLIGTFSNWQEIPMHRVRDGNFWEVQAETVPPGSLYKFRIHRPDGGVTDHADPYAFGAELWPAPASVYWGQSLYRVAGGGWVAREGRRGGRFLWRGGLRHIHFLHLFYTITQGPLGQRAPKAASKPSQGDLGSGLTSAARGRRRAGPATGGANWTKVQFTAVIISWQKFSFKDQRSWHKWGDMDARPLRLPEKAH